MSQTRWVLVIFVGVILWLASRGRLADVVYAMEHGGSGASSAGAGASPSSTAAAPSLGPWQGAFAPSAYFLDAQPSGVASGFSVPGVAALDTAGIQALRPGDRAAADWDYAVATGSAVHLPAGGPYTVLPSWSPGRTAAFRTPNGGILEFLHLSQDFVTNAAGQNLAGGTRIGASGSPSGPLEAGSGAHLAVVLDQDAINYLRGA